MAERFRPYIELSKETWKQQLLDIMNDSNHIHYNSKIAFKEQDSNKILKFISKYDSKFKIIYDPSGGFGDTRITLKIKE